MSQTTHSNTHVIELVHRRVVRIGDLSWARVERACDKLRKVDFRARVKICQDIRYANAGTNADHAYVSEAWRGSPYCFVSFRCGLKADLFNPHHISPESRRSATMPPPEPVYILSAARTPVGSSSAPCPASPLSNSVRTRSAPPSPAQASPQTKLKRCISATSYKPTMARTRQGNVPFTLDSQNRR